MARAKKTKGPALAADGGEPQLRSLDDDDACRVYADWLLEKGDVRGDLMALQLDPKGDRYDEARAFVQQHRAELAGSLPAELEAQGISVEVDFFRGFLRGLYLSLPAVESPPDVGAKLEALPGLPGMRFLESVRVTGARVTRIPASLAKLTGLKKLDFNNCAIRSIDEGAWAIGGDGHCDVRFNYCDVDLEALFERLLVHGPGRWKVTVFEMGDQGYVQTPRFKDVQALGDDFAGDREARAQLLQLSGGYVERASLPQTAGPAQLRFLNHSKKPLREIALRWLEKTLPKPELPPRGAKVWVLGRPTYHSKEELAAALKARGWTAAKSAAGAAAALVLDSPGDGLDLAVKASLPVVLEARLNATVTSDAPGKGAKAAAADADGTTEKLLSADPKEVLAAIEAVRGGDAIPAPLLSPMFSAMCWSTDADVRKAARAALLAKGGKKAVAYLQGDRTNYPAILDGAKLWKVTRAICDTVGIEPATFALHLVRMFALRNEAWRADEPLSVGLRFPENEGKLFGWLAASQGMLVLPPLKKTFPKGLGALKAIDTLRVRGTVTSDANVAELATLPSLRRLEYGVSGADLRHLAPLKDTLRELELSGQMSNCSDLSPLREWTKLEKLNIQYSPVTDLSPIAGKTTLTTLNLEQVPVKSLDVVGGLTNLVSLSVARVEADFAPLAKLTKLQYLDVSFSKISDLRLLAGMTGLQTLKLWGAKQLTDLSPLATLPLTYLDVNDTGVTDFTPLASIRTLKTLYCYRVPMSDATLQGLKEALPALQISR